MGVLYVLDNGYASKNGGRIRITKNKEVLLDKPLISIDDIVIMGNITVTPSLLQACIEQKTGIHYISRSGTYYARVSPIVSKNAPARIGQFRAYLDPNAKLKLAKRFVEGKIKNCNTFIRRGVKGGLPTAPEAIMKLQVADNEEVVRGIEGNIAREYYSRLAIRLPEGFKIENRNRRPPRDPINSLLSLAYTFLTKEALTALHIAGLDPYVGFLHEAKYGKPALALDLVEEFRPIIADSVALTTLGKKMITEKEFDSERGFPSLNRDGFVSFLTCWEGRMNTQVYHPTTKKKLTYRQVMVAQSRLLAKLFLGEIDEYPPFLVK